MSISSKHDKIFFSVLLDKLGVYPHNMKTCRLGLLIKSYSL